MSKQVKPHNFVKQHSNPRRPKRQTLWSGVAILILFIVVVVGLLQKNTTTESIASSDFKVEINGAPRIAVKQDTVDYGDQHYNVPVESVFTVGNIGDQPLIIQGQPVVEVVEGCCPPRVELTSDYIKPGEQIALSMRFSMHAGMDGKHHFRVHVRTNDPVEPEKLLHVYSNWIP